ITYHPRGGESKLSTFRDGWRHLRFLLVHNPTALFLVPGGIMLALGAIVMAGVLAQIQLLGRTWQIHTMIAGALLAIVGSQVVALGLCARAYAFYFMSDRGGWFESARRRYRLEHGLALGAFVALAGVAVA